MEQQQLLKRLRNMKPRIQTQLEGQFLGETYSIDMIEKIINFTKLELFRVLKSNDASDKESNVLLNWSKHLYRGDIQIIPQNFFTALLMLDVYAPDALEKDYVKHTDSQGVFHWKNNRLIFEPYQVIENISFSMGIIESKQKND